MELSYFLPPLSSTVPYCICFILATRITDTWIMYAKHKGSGELKSQSDSESSPYKEACINRDCVTTFIPAGPA